MLSYFYSICSAICVIIACVNGVYRREKDRNYAKAAFHMAWAVLFYLFAEHYR